MLGTILLVFAFVFFILAAYGVPAGRWQLGWAGLACYMGSILFGDVTRLLH